MTRERLCEDVQVHSDGGYSLCSIQVARNTDLGCIARCGQIFVLQADESIFGRTGTAYAHISEFPRTHSLLRTLSTLIARIVSREEWIYRITF